MALTVLLTRLATPTVFFPWRPLQLGLLAFVLNIPVYLALKLSLWLLVDAPPHAPAFSPPPTLPFDEPTITPLLAAILAILIGPASETLAMLLFYELLHSLCRLPPWAAALPVILAAAWAHSAQGPFTLLPTLLFSLLTYEYVTYRRLRGGAAGAIAVFLTHATNNALATALVLGLTHYAALFAS